MEKFLVEKGSYFNGHQETQLYSWGGFWIFPLYTTEEAELIGMIGVLKNDEREFDPVLLEPLKVLGRRATQALEDRILQKKLFVGLEELSPKAASIQRLRAAFRFDQSGIYRELNDYNLLLN